MALDDIIRQLADLQQRLLEVAEDDFAERHRLLTRRDELRDLAARYRIDRDAERSNSELLAELAALRHQLAEAERLRIDLVMQAGGGNQATAAGGDGWGALGINQSIDRAQGRDQVLARIGRIISVLVDRGIEVADPD